MITSRDIFLGLALPFLVAGIVLLLAWRPWRRRGESSGATWAPSVSIALAFVVGFFAEFGKTKFPPGDSTDWIFFFAFALGVIALVDGMVKWPRWLRAIVALLAIGVATWLVLRPLQHGTWDTAQGWMWIASIAAAVFISWWSLDALADRVRGTGIPIVMTLVSAVTGIVLMTSGTQKVGQVAGVLTAACAAASVLAWWARGVSVSSGTAIVFTILWLCLLMSGYFFADVTPTNAALLYAAPFLAWSGELPALQSRPATRLIVRVLAVLIPLAIAGAISATTFAKAMAETGPHSSQESFEE